MVPSPELLAHPGHAIAHIAIAFALKHGFAGSTCSLFSATPSAQGRKPSLVEDFTPVLIPQHSVMSLQEDPVS
jgi:hypothetical protein